MHEGSVSPITPGLLIALEGLSPMQVPPPPDWRFSKVRDLISCLGQGFSQIGLGGSPSGALCRDQFGDSPFSHPSTGVSDMTPGTVSFAHQVRER